MKIFKPADYPVFLTDEHIGDLISMKNSALHQQEWEDIKEKLSKEEIDFVEKKEKQFETRKLREQYLASLSAEERAALPQEIIRPDDLPIEMNFRNIEILSYMADAMPPIQEWRDITDLLSYEETRIIWDRISERKKEKEQQRQASLTSGEQAEEKRKTAGDTDVFRGNLLQQELDAIELEKIEQQKKKQQDKKDADK